MTQALRIAIVGVGAIGAFIASRLHRLSQQPGGPALQLSALARGETLAVLRGQGLRFHEAGQTHTVPLQLADSTLAGAQSLGPQDLVIVAVKEPALRGLAPQIAALAGEGGRVLLAMNGLPWCFFDGLEGPLQGQTLATLLPPKSDDYEVQDYDPLRHQDWRVRANAALILADLQITQAQEGIIRALAATADNTTPAFCHISRALAAFRTWVKHWFRTQAPWCGPAESPSPSP